MHGNIFFYYKESNRLIALSQECVRGTLRDKTIILVTHQVDFLNNVDQILVCMNAFNFKNLNDINFRAVDLCVLYLT